MYLHSRNAITSQLTPSHNHSQSYNQSLSRGNHKRSQCREMRCKSPGNQVQVALALCSRRRVALSLPTCNCRRFVLPTRSLVTDPAPINCNQYTRPIPAARGCLLYAATQRAGPEQPRLCHAICNFQSTSREVLLVANTLLNITF